MPVSPFTVVLVAAVDEHEVAAVDVLRFRQHALGFLESCRATAAAARDFARRRHPIHRMVEEVEPAEGGYPRVAEHQGVAAGEVGVDPPLRDERRAELAEVERRQGRVLLRRRREQGKRAVPGVHAHFANARWAFLKRTRKR